MKENIYTKMLTSPTTKKHKATREDVSWFNIKNYSFVRKLTIIDMLEELYARLELIGFSSPEELIDFPSIKKSYIDITSGKPEIRKNTYQETSQLEDLSKKVITADKNPLSVDIENRTIEIKSPVYELTVSHIENIYQNLKLRDFHSPYIKHITDDDEPNKTDTLTSLQKPYVDHVYLYVDLEGYTDAQLINSFKNTISTLRERYKIEKKFNYTEKPLPKNKIIDIFRNQAIPIADLLIWQRINGIQIPLSQVNKLLNLEDIDTPNKYVEFDGSNFKATKLKTFDLTFNDGRLEQLSIAIQKNENLKTMTIEELIKNTK
ncbi:DUF6387 family protein [Pectobacterium carotovorum]|uniref:DUF6387 family protein n=1 Tax=Pectobacterium carotovorum TaxID=554 RepID=UPI00050726F4|nr:DUF6387 family protein [Pectobacterium carotovorum]KFX02029.1 hypothetical protein JV33_02555 [Pectobacterium carotovorum subsp. carotovorum]KML71896.1 hypothetical protein G032_02115 [Pectobacterium carotovorum subsp. carotovorum ICMP 5702]SHG34105.1 hypothetical protein SAMN05444147_102181 [Pectobacterium carotovorum]